MVASCLIPLGCLSYSQRTRPCATVLRSTNSSARHPKPDEISRPLPLQPRQPADEFPPPAPTLSNIDYDILLNGLPPSLVHHYRAATRGRTNQAEGVLQPSNHNGESNYDFHDCGLYGCPNVTARAISRFVDSFAESDVRVSKASSLEAEAGSSDHQMRRCNHRVIAGDSSGIPSSLPPTITTSNSQSSVSRLQTEVHDARVPRLGSCTLASTVCAQDLGPLTAGGRDTRSDDERIPGEYPASPIFLNVHKDLPPLPTPSASSLPPSAQARSAAPKSGCRDAASVSSPLHSVSPASTNPLLAEKLHLKWSQDGDGSRSLARVARCDELDVCPTLETSSTHALPSYDTASRVSCPHPQQGSNGTPPLLTTPIPRVSSFLDIWDDAEGSLKRHVVTESSELIECWTEALGNLTESSSRQGRSDVGLGQIRGRTFDDGGHEGSRDKHNYAHVLRIARNIVSAVLCRWSATSSLRREVEDSAEFAPPSFDVQRPMRGRLHEQHGVEYAEGVGRDLIQGEASLREALDVARNIDLDGDARRSMRGVIAILEEFLTLDATSAGERSAWMSVELRSLSGIDSGPPQTSHHGVKEVHGELERDRRKQQLQDATVRVLLRCGEGIEVDEHAVLEAYALIMREVECHAVEERR